MAKGEGVSILRILKPAIAILPEVSDPGRKVQFKSRIFWTLLTTLIYLVCCQIPLYGVVKASSADPFYWMRVILASNRGTLMELGISPIVTAGMVMQLLAGSKIIEINQKDKEEKALFEGAQKLLAIIIALFEAVAYVWSGMYGDLDKLGAGNAILIIVQLTFAGVMVSLLDELMNKGYGISGSGISMFIAINICESIIWKSFSPITLKGDNGQEYEGAIINLFHALIIREDKLSAIQNAFQRSNLPNLNNLLATVLIFLVVIYFQGFRVDMKVDYTRAAGAFMNYPIKLFYTSNTPIILQTALVSNLYFVSQLLYRNFKQNILIRLLGHWQEASIDSQQSFPVGGLVYYISPPRDLTEIFSDPIHFIIYIIFILGTCAIFSKTWIEVSGNSPRDVAAQLKEQGYSFSGFRSGEKDIEKRLRKNIYIAATFGGMCIGALTVIADLLGAIGSGTGILLAVSIIYGYFEQFKKEGEQGFTLRDMF